jgi:hypothetical protein
MVEGAQIVAMGIDQSPTSSGWAIGSPSNDKPKYGLFELERWGDFEGARLCKFEDWLIATVKENSVTHIFYEAPVNVAMKSFDITSKQSMQIGAIHMAAFRCRTSISQVTPNDWRKRFLGFTKPVGITGDKVRPELKRLAVKACAQRGWYIESDDVAEALGILDFGLSTLSHRHAGSRDPLFRRAEWQNDVAKFRGEA